MITSVLKVGAGFMVGQVLNSCAGRAMDYLAHLPHETQEAHGNLVGAIIFVGCAGMVVYKSCKLAQSRLLGNKQ